MTLPIFPKSIFNWGTDRIDQITNVLANDPNSIAAEVTSIENTIGTMPQVESSPFLGQAVTYPNVSARISDTLLGTQHPYCSLGTGSFYIYNNQGAGTQYGEYNSYQVQYDPYNYFNGSDITVQATGLYLFDAFQAWEWHTEGYLQHSMYINGVWIKGNLWHWVFASNGSAAYTNNRYANTEFSWMGILQEGDRIRITSENGTNRNPYHVIDSNAKLFLLRQTPAGQPG